MSCDEMGTPAGQKSGCGCRNQDDAAFAGAGSNCGYNCMRPNCVAYGMFYPGREPIYDYTNHPGGFKPKGKQMGWWYSTTYGECVEGGAVGGESRDETHGGGYPCPYSNPPNPKCMKKQGGKQGCTWLRHPVAAVVKGRLLVQNGFKQGKQHTDGQPDPANWQLAMDNAKIVESIFAKHPAKRCCGC